MPLAMGCSHRTREMHDHRLVPTSLFLHRMTPNHQQPRSKWIELGPRHTPHSRLVPIQFWGGGEQACVEPYRQARSRDSTVAVRRLAAPCPFCAAMLCSAANTPRTVSGAGRTSIVCGGAAVQHTGGLHQGPCMSQCAPQSYRPPVLHTLPGYTRAPLCSHASDRRFHTAKYSRRVMSVLVLAILSGRPPM